MKKSFLIIGFVVSLLLFWRCEKEMMDYEGKPGIYFAVQTIPPTNYGDPELFAYTDTTLLPFSILLTNDSILNVKVRVMGDVVDYDRPFKVHIVDTATDAVVGEDYDALEQQYVIKGGERETFIPITGHRQAKMLDTVYYLTLELEANEHFDLPLKYWRPLDQDYTDKTKIINVIRHVIGFSDGIYQPRAWTYNYLGKCTRKKLNLICSMFGLQTTDFDDANEMTMTRQRGLAQSLDRYLKEKDAKGETVYEDEVDKDGKPVKMTVGPLI